MISSSSILHREADNPQCLAQITSISSTSEPVEVVRFQCQCQCGAAARSLSSRSKLTAFLMFRFWKFDTFSQTYFQVAFDLHQIYMTSIVAAGTQVQEPNSPFLFSNQANLEHGMWDLDPCTEAFGLHSGANLGVMWRDLLFSGVNFGGRRERKRRNS